MTQQQVPPRGPATPSSASLGCLLRGCSWGWGILSILMGCTLLSSHPFHAAAAILLGLLLLPPVRGFIGRAMGVRLATPVAISLAVLIMGVMIVMGRDIDIEQKAEKKKQAAIEKERRRQEDAFIASYPYVDRDSLRAWVEVAADSATDPDLTLGEFLERQKVSHAKHLSDSTADARQRWQDSSTRAKTWRKDSIASEKSRVSDSIDAARRATLEQDRPIQRAQSAPEMYNGHIVYTGPRGGRYYINDNGNKTYIR